MNIIEILRYFDVLTKAKLNNKKIFKMSNLQTTI